MKSSIVSGENRGSINNILLKALQSGDKYGYEINKEIETKSKGCYFLKEASLYSGLKRLQANGYITSYWKDGELGIRRHYYSITDKGINKLNSSNFTWDISKEFIDEIFKNPNKEKEVKQNSENLLNTPLTSNNLNCSFPNSNIIDSIQNSKQPNNFDANKKEASIKKNPFQYEVNPMQTSLFDTFFNDKDNSKNSSLEHNVNDNNPGSLLLKENFDEIKKEFNKDEKIISESDNNNVLGENKSDPSENRSENIENKNEIIENNRKDITNIVDTEREKDYPKPTNYEDLISSFNQNSYSTSLEKDNNKIDISSLLKKEKKENDTSIITDNTNKTNNSNIINAFDNKEIINGNNLEIIKNEDSSLSKLNGDLDNKKEITIENKKGLDLHNIFGSLLVNNDSKSSNIAVEENIINKEEQVVQSKKEELPRIKLKDDVNITLSAPKTNDESNDFSFSTNINPYKTDEKRYPSATNNNPSVKQYLNNVRTQKIISNATNINDEVNLEGFNIREYSKINNKPIKNSNYIYINKLNLFLIALFTALIMIESTISLTTLTVLTKSTTFEFLFFILISLSMLICLSYQIKQFRKDKFKVIIKKYSLKSSLFYTILIFIVSAIILICINIFQGMSSNNISDFALKFLFEILICLNIVIYPISKYLCYKLSRFSN